MSRRAGISSSTMAYLVGNTRPATAGRRLIKPEHIARLATVLPVSADELTREATLAAGHAAPRTRDGDLATAVLGAVRAFYGDDGIGRQERDRVTAAILRVISEDVARSGRAAEGEPPPAPTPSR